jgi:hypothetical protein
VLEEANSTEFGLSASVWTNDLQKALHATRKLEAGTNQPSSFDITIYSRRFIYLFIVSFFQVWCR